MNMTVTKRHELKRNGNKDNSISFSELESGRMLVNEIEDGKVKKSFFCSYKAARKYYTEFSGKGYTK